MPPAHQENTEACSSSCAAAQQPHTALLISSASYRDSGGMEEVMGHQGGISLHEPAIVGQLMDLVGLRTGNENMSSPQVQIGAAPAEPPLVLRHALTAEEADDGQVFGCHRVCWA